MHTMAAILVGFCFGIAVAQEMSSMSLTRSSLAFSQALYNELASNSSIVYSPINIQAALGMLLAGAGEGATYNEINSVAFLNPDVPVNKDFKKLLVRWRDLTKVHLYIANGVYLEALFYHQKKSQYEEVVSSDYFARFARLDVHFQVMPEKLINAYVERLTKNHIKNLLPPNSITYQKDLVIVNTIYFNGIWKEGFDKNYITKADFYVPHRGTIQVDMMQSRRTINIRRNVLGADVIELPYEDNFAFYVVVSYNITQLETSLKSPGAVNQLFEGFKEEHLFLKLPKFKIESEIMLNDPLIQLGIKTAFSKNANFTGISKYAYGLSVTEVLHKAVIEVQENGTTNTPAMNAVPYGRGQMHVPYYTVFRPFIFFIRDRQTNITLFQGKFWGKSD